MPFLLFFFTFFLTAFLPVDGSARSQGRKWYGQKALLLLVGGVGAFLLLACLSHTALEGVVTILGVGGFLSMAMGVVLQIAALVYLAVERFSPIASRDDVLEMGFRRVPQ